MLDFTSAIYLGLKHPVEALKPWRRLTEGRPAVLGMDARSDRLARRVALLQGSSMAVLGPSTLHLFFDLCGALAECGAAFLVDAGSYPIACWAVQRAMALGAPARSIGHHDCHGLWLALRDLAPLGRRPVLVVDGFCPGCGSPAPLAEYGRVLREGGGIMLTDDTQAWGVLGGRPGPGIPYGFGGGGSLKFQNASLPEAAVVCSWAKAFGVPIASLSGSESMLRLFLRASRTRVHCSPPSQAALAAAEHALDLNRRWGDALRRRLALRVQRFRSRLKREGVTPSGGLFPVQSVVVASPDEARRVAQRMSRAGLAAVLQKGCRGGARITFLITASHGAADIDNAAEILLGALDSARGGRKAPPERGDFRSASAEQRVKGVEHGRPLFLESIGPPRGGGRLL